MLALRAGGEILARAEFFALPTGNENGGQRARLASSQNKP